MKFRFLIESDKKPNISNENEYIKKTISIEADSIDEAWLKVRDEITEEKIPNSFLPMTVIIQYDN